MKNYEKLNLEIIALDASDVIATSAEVTTGAITMPWQQSNDLTPASFNLMREAADGNYEF